LESKVIFRFESVAGQVPSTRFHHKPIVLVLFTYLIHIQNHITVYKPQNPLETLINNAVDRPCNNIRL